MSKADDGDTRWLEPEELVAWRYLSSILLLLPGKLDEPLAEHGLTFFDYQILTALSGPPDHTHRMSNLAFLTRGSLSRLSHAAKRLEKKGWIRRHPCADDKRVTLATLTEEGVAKLVAVAPTHVASVRDAIFDHLDAQGVDQLRTVCSTIMASIAPGPPPWELYDS